MDRWYRIAAMLVLTAPALPALGQNYPDRPIRVIASQGAGGLSDVWMRAVADQLGPILGGTLVVDSAPGKGTRISARIPLTEERA